MRLFTHCAAVAVCLLVVGCAATVEVQEPQRVPPFEVRPTAWGMFIKQYPELQAGGKKAGNKQLGLALTAFYKVINDKNAERDRKQRVQRRRDCNRAWGKLTQAMARNRDLKNPLLLARAYLATECGFPRKSIAPLRNFVKRRESADVLYYSAQFWYAESILQMGNSKGAIARYRWILGELDSPLYPLAMLRTAHCHWDNDNAEKAREYLGHVNDWIGDKTGPLWVLSLKQQVADDLEEFSE